MPAADCPSESCCGDDWISGLARDHAGRLAAIARREGTSASDALDVIQDAFHTLLGRTDIAALRNRPGEALRLIFTIVRTPPRNLRRRHHLARPHVELDAEPAAEPRPDDALEQAAVAVQLVSCLARLGAVHRQIVTLRVLEELSGEEAARALGLTPTTSPCCCTARASSSSAACRPREPRPRRTVASPRSPLRRPA
jgi:RNA polymerase sigma factor (sigma-70 family)